MNKEPRYVIAGLLRRDFLFPPGTRPLLDVPGGTLIYAAAGLGVWDGNIGLLARVGEDYPHEWLRTFEKHGWDTRGVHILTEALDLRYFQGWTDLENIQTANPVAYFAREGLPFPKSMLGYQPPSSREDDRKTTHPASPRPVDIPPYYLEARIAHICPLDYMTTSRLLTTFRHAGVVTCTLDPSAGYMNVSALDDVRTICQGLTAFLCSERKIKGLFWGKTDDLWQMAEELGKFGCEYVVIRRGPKGQMLYDAASKKRWEVPAYPVRMVNPIGAGSSFCGGFLAGYQKTYDPLQAVLYGGISASLTIEGDNVFHALDTLPGLAQARLSSLADLVRRV